MAAGAFDTLQFVKRMQPSGMEPKQAEALAETLSEVALEQVATRADLKGLALRLTIRIGGMLAVAVAILGALITLQ